MSEEVITFDKIIKECGFSCDQHKDIGTKYRLYFSPNSTSERGGFKFLVLHWTSTYILEDNAFSDLTQTTGEVICQGVAYFDGIRHMEFGFKPSLGYFNYPRVNEISVIMNELYELEKQYCILDQL